GRCWGFGEPRVIGFRGKPVTEHGGSSDTMTLGTVPITEWIGSRPRQDKKSGQSPGQFDGRPAGRSDLGDRSCPRGGAQALINSAGSGTWGNRRHFAANNRVWTDTADRRR